jgi:hypothetical protein
MNMGGSDYNPCFDSRREIWRLLQHLDARTRLRFLQSCCDMFSTATVKTTVDKDNDGSVNAVYWDLQSLMFDRGGNIEQIGEKLVRWVKRFGVEPSNHNRSGVGYRATLPA